MRFELDDPDDGIVRVVNHIPDGALVRLRGRNGVGKTVALRLIQLCAGGANPWTNDPASWRSLAQAIPDGYSIRAIDDDREIQWTVHPRRDKWIKEPTTKDRELDRALLAVPDVDSVRVETRVNGVLQSTTDARPLTVSLLSGRESLLDVWAAELLVDLRRFTEVATLAERRLGASRERYGRLQRAADESSPSMLRSLQSTVEDDRSKLETLEEQVEELRRLRERSQLEHNLRERLAEAEATIPGLDEQFRQLLDREDEIRSDLEDIAEQTSLRLSRRDLDPPELERLDRAQRNADKRRESHAMAIAKLAEILANPLLDGLERSAIEDAQGEVQRELASLDRQIRRLHSDEPVLDLATQLQTTASGHRGSEQDVLIDDEDVVITVERLQAGLSKRIEALEASGPLTRLEEQRSLASEKLVALEGAIEAERVLQQKASLVTEVIEAEQRREQDQQIVDALVERREVAEAELEQVEDKKLDLTRERQRILGDATGLEQLRALVEQRGDPAPSVDEEKLAELERARAGAEAAFMASERRLREAERSAKSAIALLEEAGLPASDAGNHARVEVALGQASTTIEQMETQLILVRSAYQMLRARLAGEDEFESALAGRASAAEEGLAKYYAARWQGQLDSPSFQSELFQGGQLEAIDLIGGHFRWTDGGGQTQQRPLRALSSGQMVYAYTKAVISGLEAPAADRYRLIALDEFGAYLDQHAQERLLDDLRNHLERSPRTKIVIVLPDDPKNDLGYVAEVIA